MDLYFVRHGETDYNYQKRLQGHLDIELNETGRNQARQVAEAVEDLDINLIISSPQKRALETARIIAEKVNVEIITDADLKERSFGELEGMTFGDVLKKHPEFMEIIRSADGKATQGSESLSEVENRIKRFLKSLSAFENHKRILLVSHGGTGRVFLKLLKGIADFEKTEFNNCQIVKFDI